MCYYHVEPEFAAERQKAEAFSMTRDEPRSVLARAASDDGMTGVGSPPERDETATDETVTDGTATDGMATDGTADGSRPPYVLLRNADDVERTVALSITWPDGVLVGEEYRLPGERVRSVTLGEALENVLRIEIDAETGGTARVSLDPSRVGEAPIPEFVVRGDRISVSGLSIPFEPALDSGTVTRR